MQSEWVHFYVNLSLTYIFSSSFSFFLSPATILSPYSASPVCRERVDHLSHQQEETSPAGGSVVVLRWGGDESVVATVPARPSQASLLPLSTHHAALPHQHLPTGCAVWGCPSAGGYQWDCALWWSAGIFWATWGPFPFLHSREDFPDLPPSHPEAAACSQPGWTGIQSWQLNYDTCFLQNFRS